LSSETERDAIVLGQLIHDIAHALAVENVEEVVDVGIGFEYISLLLRIQNLGKPTMTELGHASGIQLSTLTRMVDRFVELNYVERRSDPSDRRIVRVLVTRQGDVALQKFAVAYEKRIQSVLRHVTIEEHEQLVQTLKKVHKRLLGKGGAGR
jgi:DNA-binding MarR family transcriptional regulator